MDEGVSQTPRSFSKIYEDCCPFYLSIGMTADEYWNGDNELPKYYREAYRMKQEQENHVAWLYGMYVYDATMSALSHLSPNKNEHKNYAEKPYSFKPADVKKDEEAKKIEARARAEVWMKAWVSATRKKFKDK